MNKLKELNVGGAELQANIQVKELSSDTPSWAQCTISPQHTRSETELVEKLNNMTALYSELKLKYAENEAERFKLKKELD